MKVLALLSSLFASMVSMEVLGRESLGLMLPWIVVMTAFVVADFASGVRKGMMLGVRVSWSTAIRETAVKWVQYFSIILAVCMLSVVYLECDTLAEVVSLGIMALEGGSVLSNTLRPYGIIITPKGVLMWLLRKSPIAGEVTDLVREEEIEKARREEDKKWNTRSKSKKHKDETTEQGKQG